MKFHLPPTFFAAFVALQSLHSTHAYVPTSSAFIIGHKNKTPFNSCHSHSSYCSVMAATNLDTTEVTAASTVASVPTTDTTSTDSSTVKNENRDTPFTAYVVNLSYTTTLQQLHTLFSQHAPVAKVYMPFDKVDPNRSKGYAFVSLSSKEDLSKVISTLNESQLDGRMIFVTEAKPRGAKQEIDPNSYSHNNDPASSSSDSYSDGSTNLNKSQTNSDDVKLYVGNLSFDTTEDDLRDLFQNYGQVTDVYLPIDQENGRQRGFAFVTIKADDISRAIDETDGCNFQGRNIVVNKPLPRGQKLPKRSPQRSTRSRQQDSSSSSRRSNSTNSNTVKLYVGNLSFDTTEDDIRTLFERFGSIVDVYVPLDQASGRRRGFAFVTMNADDAPTAIEETDGYEVDGRTLRVNAAQPKGSSSGGRYNDDSGDGVW